MDIDPARFKNGGRCRFHNSIKAISWLSRRT